MTWLGCSAVRSLRRLHSDGDQSWSHFEDFLSHVSGAGLWRAESPGDGMAGTTLSILLWSLHIVSPDWWHQGSQTSLEARNKRGAHNLRVCFLKAASALARPWEEVLSYILSLGTYLASPWSQPCLYVTQHPFHTPFFRGLTNPSRGRGQDHRGGNSACTLYNELCTFTVWWVKHGFPFVF